MMEAIKHIFGLSRTFGMARSYEWRDLRDDYIANFPSCVVCGKIGNILKPNEVHHIVPFHLDPTLELDEKNLITLCRPHHHIFGHLNDWSSYNSDILSDVKIWRVKISQRP